MRPTIKQLASLKPNQFRVIDNHTDKFWSDFVTIVGLGDHRKIKRYNAVSLGFCKAPKN